MENTCDFISRCSVFCYSYQVKEQFKKLSKQKLTVTCVVQIGISVSYRERGSPPTAEQKERRDEVSCIVITQTMTLAAEGVIVQCFAHG